MAEIDFCGDLIQEIDRRTEELIKHGKGTFSEKLTALSAISSFRLSYDPRNIESSVNHSAKTEKTVAALVSCHEIPMSEAVFIGKLSTDNPIGLASNGYVTLKAESGVMARVWTNNDGHHLNFRPTERYDDELVPVGRESLYVVRNNTVPAIFIPSKATPRADQALVNVQGLDHKICHEGVNLPEPDSEGSIADKYDRMGLVALFGAETYVNIMHDADTRQPALW